MPLLKQVLPEVFFDTKLEYPAVAELLEEEIRAFKLNTGSPCSSHDAMFADWPGEGEYVRQWFILTNGKAVAVDERPGLPWLFPVIDYEGLI